MSILGTICIIAAVLFIGLILLIAFSCCIAAGRADRQEEEAYQEWYETHHPDN